MDGASSAETLPRKYISSKFSSQTSDRGSCKFVQNSIGCLKRSAPDEEEIERVSRR